MADMVYKAEQVLKLTSEGTPHKSQIPIPFKGLTDSTCSMTDTVLIAEVPILASFRTMPVLV